MQLSNSAEIYHVRRQCAACGTNMPQYDTVNTTNEGPNGRLLCTACFNREMAHAGIDDFGSIKFKPMRLIDANGVAHEFHFRTLLFGDKLSLESFESTSDEEPSGYRFQIIGDPLADQFVLLGRLIEKMRRSLAVIHNGTLISDCRSSTIPYVAELSGMAPTIYVCHVSS